VVAFVALVGVGGFFAFRWWKKRTSAVPDSPYSMTTIADQRASGLSKGDYRDTPVVTELGPAPLPEKSKSRMHMISFRNSTDMGWEIKFNEITVMEELGAGAYGVVFLGSWRETLVAVKQLHTKMTDEVLDAFRNEVQLMKKMRPHPNVLGLLGVCTQAPPYAIITQYVEGGSLSILLKSKTALSPDTLFDLTKGVARGLNHLHLEKIVHRDLAARNILVKELKSGYQPLIADFGLSRFHTGETEQSTTKAETGPLKTMAPECLVYKNYSTKSDVWSFGVLLEEIYGRKDPYSSMDAVQVAVLVGRGELLPKPPPGMPTVLVGVMSQCCKYNADERITMSDVCKILDSKM